MKTRLINMLVVLFGLTFSVNGQTLKEKTEMLFENNKNLIEKNHEFFNLQGQITKRTTSDYRNNESITITDYFYNNEGRLVKEVFTGLRSFLDSTGTKHWTDSSYISIKHFEYNSNGQIQFEKDYNFQCNLDSCDIIEFFYQGNLLVKKCCSNDCSMKGLRYNYPIYYKYDKNDSLILEQAWGPTDTTKIWYTNSYNYALLPDKYIYERFYRNDDSLKLESRTVTRTQYQKDGKKLKIINLEKDSSYEGFEYYKSGLQKSQVSVRNGKPTWKLVYKYDKHKNIVRIETYDENKDKKDKLKLYYYQTYQYKYY